MKYSFIHNVLALVLAIFFLTAGTGYNLAYFCCSDCENAGIASITTSCCEEIHHHHSDEDETPLCIQDVDHLHSHTLNTHFCDSFEYNNKSCEFKRLTTEIPTFEESDFNFDSVQFPVLTTFYNLCFSQFEMQEENHSSFFPQNIDTSLLISGREILSNISTLLI